ncbi:uncharacterized protein METZ01_LOCUS283419 [marine metagenome]|uniref:Uncharacterized protein n=1 Tax=marine metagenome TaxID=408172 RepID=A0A382L431_9ZZZZ
MSDRGILVEDVKVNIDRVFIFADPMSGACFAGALCRKLMATKCR